MDELVTQTLSADRFAVRLLGILSALTLILAATGIAGVMAHAVQQRTHELAVRISLGAQRRDVLKLVMGQGLRVALAGTAIGLAATWTLTRLVRTMLFETSATDPLTLAAVTALMALVVLAACGVPARRAAGVDPVAALRGE
jgi:ABC-type antimicrobial peptide transport system permease subunit